MSYHYGQLDWFYKPEGTTATATMSSSATVATPASSSATVVTPAPAAPISSPEVDRDVEDNSRSKLLFIGAGVIVVGLLIYLVLRKKQEGPQSINSVKRPTPKTIKVEVSSDEE